MSRPQDSVPSVLAICAALFVLVHVAGSRSEDETAPARKARAARGHLPVPVDGGISPVADYPPPMASCRIDEGCAFWVCGGRDSNTRQCINWCMRTVVPSPENFEHCREEQP